MLKCYHLFENLSAIRMLGLFIGSNKGSSRPFLPRYWNTMTRVRKATEMMRASMIQCTAVRRL